MKAAGPRGRCFGCLVVALASYSHAASADESLTEFGNESVVHRTLDETRGACVPAQAVIVHFDDLKLCRPKAEGHTELLELAKELEVWCSASASEPLAAAKGKLEAERAASASRLETSTQSLAEAEAKLAELERKLAEASAETRPELERELEENKTQAQALGVEIEGTKAVLVALDAELERVRQAEDRAKAGPQLNERFNAEFDRVMFGSADAKDFALYQANAERQRACLSFTGALYVNDAAGLAEAKAAGDKLVSEVPEEAHATDTLRKSSNLSTPLAGDSPFIEKPGAPDAVTASVMSALGADETTSGTQAVMTLNLATLLEPLTRERLASVPLWRNLFLRASLPLEATEQQPPADAADEVAPAPPNDVRRFSFVLGTSLLDDSDPRLDSNRTCYERVVDYLPIASSDAAESRIKPLRSALFDMCHHEAARAQRIALRGAVGLATELPDQDTDLELMAGALVWGPTPWLYLNGIYQHVFEPERADTFGVGFSLGFNASRSQSGVDAWARFSLDTVALASPPNAVREWQSELRLVPTIQYRVGDSIGSLGIGPKVVRSRDTDVGFLATLAVTYDADQLINPLLTEKH